MTVHAVVDRTYGLKLNPSRSRTAQRSLRRYLVSEPRGKHREIARLPSELDTLAPVMREWNNNLRWVEGMNLAPNIFIILPQSFRRLRHQSSQYTNFTQDDQQENVPIDTHSTTRTSYPLPLL